MRTWSTSAVAGVVRDILIPAGGLYGILVDRPLSPLAAGAYVVMMGLPVAGVLDSRRERRNTDAAAPTPPEPPGRTP